VGEKKVSYLRKKKGEWGVNSSGSGRKVLKFFSTGGERGGGGGKCYHLIQKRGEARLLLRLRKMVNFRSAGEGEKRKKKRHPFFHREKKRRERRTQPSVGKILQMKRKKKGGGGKRMRTSYFRQGKKKKCPRIRGKKKGRFSIPGGEGTRSRGT